MTIRIGYWEDTRRPAPDGRLPRPHNLVGPWNERERATVLAHLRAGTVTCSWRGSSYCRFECGEQRMGSTDLTDGVYEWPAGLAHYVEMHSVRLPEPFVGHVLKEAAR